MVADDGSANGGQVVVGLGKEMAQLPRLLPLDQRDLREGDVFPTMKRKRSHPFLLVFSPRPAIVAGMAAAPAGDDTGRWYKGGGRATPTALDLEELRCLGT